MPDIVFDLKIFSIYNLRLHNLVGKTTDSRLKIKRLNYGIFFIILKFPKQDNGLASIIIPKDFLLLEAYSVWVLLTC